MNTLQAIAQCKCPQCHKGEMFSNKYRLFRPAHMNIECPVCFLRYEIELGFFWASMYVSYALNIAEIVTIALAINILTGSSNPWLYSVIIVIAILLFMSFNYRYGRVLLLYMFGGISYDRSYEDIPEKSV